MAATSRPLFTLILAPKPLHLLLPPRTSSISSITRIHPTSSPPPHSLNQTSHNVSPKFQQRWKLFATPENYVLSEAESTEVVQNTQQVVSSPDNGVNTIVSSLLFVAFVGLSILTIGVIYIAVTDFLQKRESEKFEKEEAAKKKSGKKGAVRVRRGGPRGFGQKVDFLDDDE